MSNSTNQDVKFSLKVMINKQKTKVLFAEVDSDFADVLLSFLTMPLGTIVRVLNRYYGDEAPVFGSFTTLYNGLSNLDNDHFSTERGKKMLLNPRASCEAECFSLKLKIDPSDLTKYSTCDDTCKHHLRYYNIGLSYGPGATTATCGCGKTLKWELCLQAPCQADFGVFTIKRASFVISDDLRIVPNVYGSVLETLSHLGITDTLGAELRNVTFGHHEIMGLLEVMFLSETPLTDIILNKKQVDGSVTPKTEPGIFSHEVAKEANADNHKKIVLKVMIQKSTNKLLFAQAGEDFVNFLFSFLTVPLGGVEYLLGGNACLKNVDNLYRSVANIDGDKYLKTKDTKTMLLNPKQAHGYISKSQFLPLEERPPSLYYFNDDVNGHCFSTSANMGGRAGHSLSSYKSMINGEGNCVKGLGMYMVTDDLIVTPLCLTSSLSVLNGLDISLSDIEELELDIGLEGALKILKASLTSTSALTDSLIKHLVKKCVKQEV